LTYGGDWVAQEIVAHAKRRGIPVVFALQQLCLPWGRAVSARGCGTRAIAVRAGALRPQARVKLHADPRPLGLDASTLPGN
jgi:hypothetical protein